MPVPSAPPEPPWDPVFLRSRREAFWILVVWAASLLWVVPYCYRFGYPEPEDPSQLATVAGIPAWLVWGVFGPWLVATAITTWFCFGYMQDADLGDPDHPLEEDELPPSAPRSEGPRK